MPVAFGSISSAGAADPASGVTVTAPSGIVNGDLLIAAGLTPAADVTGITLPTGFTEVLDSEPAIGSPRFAWGWKIAASESGNYLIQKAAGSDAAWAGLVARFTGVNEGSPINANGSTLYEQANENPADITCPTVTTNTSDTMILRIVCLQWASANGAGLVIQTAGYTERADEGEPDSPNTNVGVALYTIDTNQATAGATGTATVRSSVAGNKQGVGITIAISPLAGGRGPIFGFGGGLGEWTRRFWNTGRN